MSDVELRCYCCGEPISGTFALVTTSPFAVDRVFVAKPDHVELFEDDARSLLVAPVPRDQNQERSHSRPDSQTASPGLIPPDLAV